MPRAKRGFKRRRRHNKVLERASGFVLGLRNKYSRTAEAVDRAMGYAYRDRRAKKRDFRRLWITRIGAATRQHGMSYSTFIRGLKVAEVDLDRKVLADMAVRDPDGFKGLVEVARNGLGS